MKLATESLFPSSSSALDTCGDSSVPNASSFPQGYTNFQTPNLRCMSKYLFSSAVFFKQELTSFLIIAQ